jgi:hypothetical protein
MMLEFREWLSRKLLNLAFSLDRGGKVVCDAQRGWIFRRDWVQPKSGGDSGRV